MTNIDQRLLFGVIKEATSTQIPISLCFEVELTPVGCVLLRYDVFPRSLKNPLWWPYFKIRWFV